MIIQPIVEGHGEVPAVPVLLRRIGASLELDIQVLPPIRQKRNRIVKDGELERVVELAARKCPSESLILILLDADEDCPATLGPALLERASAARPDRTVTVVLANREFESWFLGGVEGLSGRRGLDADLATPGDPESVSDAKAWLAERMNRGRGPGYSPTIHQAAFAATFDMTAARTRCPSFDKFLREIEKSASRT